jgi:acyl carrier protein
MRCGNIEAIKSSDGKASLENLKQIVSEIFNIEINQIRDELGPSDIKAWDSLGQLRLIMTIEAQFNITIEIEEIFEILTIGDIKKLLKKKGIK